MAAEQPPITVYVRPGDPESAAVLQYLQQRGLAFTTRDVLSDPSASAVLFGRLGRVAVPTLQVGERMLVGYDPVQLARFLPSPTDDEPGVSFGASVRTAPPEVASAAGLPVAYGVEVGRVSQGSPAEKAGVQPGDVITAIGPYTLQGGAEQFRTAVAARRPGDTMTLTVRRGGEDHTLVVAFGSAGADVGSEQASPI